MKRKKRREEARTRGPSLYNPRQDANRKRIESRRLLNRGGVKNRSLNLLRIEGSSEKSGSGLRGRLAAEIGGTHEKAQQFRRRTGEPGETDTRSEQTRCRSSDHLQ